MLKSTQERQNELKRFYLNLTTINKVGEET